MAAVITGMEPYYQIDTGAPVAAAFRHKAASDQSPLLRGSAWLIAVGALAGMTSVLLVIFLEPGAHLPGDGPRRTFCRTASSASCTNGSARRTARRC